MKIEMNAQSKTLKEGFDEFIKHCTVRDCTESTLINCQTTIRNFNKFSPAHTPLNDITKNAIEDYIC